MKVIKIASKNKAKQTKKKSVKMEKKMFNKF